MQVHVSFISKQNSFLVTEKILRDIFSPYGAVADVAIKKHVAVPVRCPSIEYCMPLTSPHRLSLFCRNKDAKVATASCTTSTSTLPIALCRL